MSMIFMEGQYIGDENTDICINVEVIVIDLNEEQKIYFRNHLEWWNTKDNKLIDGPPPEGTDVEGVFPRVACVFSGLL